MLSSRQVNRRFNDPDMAGCSRRCTTSFGTALATPTVNAWAGPRQAVPSTSRSAHVR